VVVGRPECCSSAVLEVEQLRVTDGFLLTFLCLRDAEEQAEEVSDVVDFTLVLRERLDSVKVDVLSFLDSFITVLEEALAEAILPLFGEAPVAPSAMEAKGLKLGQHGL